MRYAIVDKKRGESMDANVSAHFYRVTSAPDGVLDFPDLLLSQAAKPLHERERDVTGTGIMVRLEDCIAEGEYIIGQFCRKQTSNIPPQAGPEGLTPIALAEGKGLGHVAAFRYHRPTRVIVTSGKSSMCDDIQAGALFDGPQRRRDFWDGPGIARGRSRTV